MEVEVHLEFPLCVYRIRGCRISTSHFLSLFSTSSLFSSGVISLTSNIVVLLMFVKFKELRTATNFIIINLALTDVGVAGIGYPMSAASDIHGSWKFGYTGCQVGGILVLNCNFAVLGYSVHTISLTHLREICNVLYWAVWMKMTWLISKLKQSTLKRFVNHSKYNVEMKVSVVFWCIVFFFFSFVWIWSQKIIYSKVSSQKELSYMVPSWK